MRGVDRVRRTVARYGEHRASLLAAATTYFAFLSFFPILALAFAGVGFASQVFPSARESLETALSELLPGMIGDGPRQLSVDDIRAASGAAAGLGLVTVLYSGTGWISGMRTALGAIFESSAPAAGDGVVATVGRYVMDRVRDAAALLAIGGTLLLSVGVSGAASGFSARIADALGLDRSVGWLLAGTAIAVGLLAKTVLFLAMFRLLARPAAGWRALVSGAVLGAIGFEILTQASGLLLASTGQQPAFQAFGIALILLVWIYYTQRLVLFAAAWAATAGDRPAIR